MTTSQDSGPSAPRSISRRTVVKGAAWAAPAVAIASAAPAYANSIPVPPPPSVNWGSACATIGNGRGCSGQEKALQVPLTITNNTADQLLFVVEGAWSANGNPTPPATAPAPGSLGSGNGFYGIGTDSSNCVTLTPPTACGSISPIASTTSKVLVPAGGTLNLWYAFNTTDGDASSFVGKIWYTWYDPATCTEVGDGGDSQTENAIEPNNCHNLPNP